MSESDLVKNILDMIEQRRRAGQPIEAVKKHGSRFSKAGEPDIDCVQQVCCPCGHGYFGQSYKLEVKVGKEEASELQSDRLRRWRAAGAVAEVVRSVADVERLLGPTGKQPLIETCGRDAILSVLHFRPHVIISIVDPLIFGDGRPLPLPLEPNGDLLDLLTLQFADYHEKHFKKRDGQFLESLAMTRHHASAVRQFLEKYRDRLEAVIVHCEAGVSRSPSMALAIAEWMGVSRYAIEPVSRNWDAQPLNPWVYRLTKEALEASVRPAETRRLKT